ncbi:MAG: hydantoinase/oxoprolinase family protein [Candidatus Dormibacteraeota bacterium]|nr:hydantoinase/oxoprolinase family protein [Candidatus Dormibacteraeota bacterium]MBO0743826.1 hydantoinase/oxoprolinase family protein [Candidatus Dormibacteraeota bacterium]
MPRQDDRVGVDIGGTFTDLVLLRGDRVAAVSKTLTTPRDPSLAVAQGVTELLRRAGGDGAGAVREVVHGTTLVPNALIERTGARVALLTTAGFRDVLAIRREHRYDLYDLNLELPEPLVPRRRRWEITERVLADGSVDTELDEAQVRRLAGRLRRERVEAVAVSLLHAYRNPRHEQRVGELLREALPGVSLSLSSEVVPELGEYVRSSTTVANAYVQPLMDRYLGRLERRLRDAGIEAPLHVMLSTGGLADLATARRFPIRLAESGPAAGAISAAFTGRAAGVPDVLAFDMGGTTAKACLVERGQPLIAREHEVARVHRFARESGLPIRLPVVDLIEIGAGGGSIARPDRFGLPRVGPDSAGSDPGPACYGRGGDEPTVTDADLVLGYLDPEFFLGGEMRLSVEAAQRALAGFAAGIGLTLEEAAAGIHRVVNENMAAAARMHAIERGRDPGKLVMVATGGAGPVHAWGVAKALDLRRIMLPPSAGVASAFGMLTAPPAFDQVRSLPSLLGEVDWHQVRSALHELRGEGVRRLAATGVTGGQVGVELAADLRHRGQGDSITVPLGATLARRAAPHVEQAFDAAYAGLYGRRPPGVEVEVLAWRVRVRGPEPPIRLCAEPVGGRAGKGRRPIWSAEKGGFVEARVVDRYRLRPGEVVRGPAVIEERESTAMVGLGGRAEADGAGNLVVTIDG